MKTAFSWPPFLAGLLAGILFGGIGGYLVRQSNAEADAEAAGRAFIRGMEPTPEEQEEAKKRSDETIQNLKEAEKKRRELFQNDA